MIDTRLESIYLQLCTVEKPFTACSWYSIGCWSFRCFFLFLRLLWLLLLLCSIDSWLCRDVYCRPGWCWLSSDGKFGWRGCMQRNPIRMARDVATNTTEQGFGCHGSWTAQSPVGAL